MGKKARNADYIKEYNRKEVLRILRRNPMSRAELARATGLTRAATSMIGDELLAEGILEELPPHSVGRGRSAIPLAVRENCYYVLAVQLNRAGCSVGLCDFVGHLIRKREVSLKGDLIFPIVRALNEILGNIDKSRVLGIGISCPGPVDTHEGRILKPPRFDRWHGVALGPILEEEMGIPAYLENDACALALHQLEIGDSRDFVLLVVDSGVGSGVVSLGKLLGGAGNFTCELGHTSICYNGRQCECGNKGCLEAYASIPNILKGSSYKTWEELIANLGREAEAENLLNQEVEYLSAGIINLLNLIQLDTVYLAGTVRNGYEHLEWRLQKEINNRSISRQIGPAKIQSADLRQEAELLAAGDVVISRYLLV